MQLCGAEKNAASNVKTMGRDASGRFRHRHTVNGHRTSPAMPNRNENPTPRRWLSRTNMPIVSSCPTHARALSTLICSSVMPQYCVWAMYHMLQSICQLK